MNIKKEVLEIEENLHKRINNMLSFLNIKADILKGSIISINNTNLAYIEPHKLIINGITYLFFNECKNVYINKLEYSISCSSINKLILKIINAK